MYDLTERLKTTGTEKSLEVIKEMFLSMGDEDQKRHRKELDKNKKYSGADKELLLQKRKVLFEAAIDYLMTIIKLEVDDATPFMEIRLALVLPNKTFLRIKQISNGGIRVQRPYGNNHQVIHLLTNNAVFALGQIAIDIQGICQKTKRSNQVGA